MQDQQYSFFVVVVTDAVHAILNYSRHTLYIQYDKVVLFLNSILKHLSLAVTVSIIALHNLYKSGSLGWLPTVQGTGV